MERIEDLESKKRAEEIYSRRNGISISENKKKYFSIYKFCFQLLVLINLSIVFIMYSNRNFVFSSEFLKQVNDFYKFNISEKIQSILFEENEKKENSNENVQNQIVEEKKEEEKVENLQGKEIDDICNIKECYSFIKPIDGIITSFFGNRISDKKNILGFHTGVDISALEGTKIKASIDGVVILVSNQGNYGKHLKIQQDNIITLYAHCKDILVNEGDYIIQGQEIAEVGSTGNSTGPHLHFEIRYNNEYLNPNDYIAF